MEETQEHEFQHPLVSVVMPVHNAAPYVVQAVESVLAQRVPCALELIVVDDGSTDAGVQALAPYLDRITLISQPNQGVGAARNAGLRYARGDYVAFLDADDVWAGGKLAAQLQHLQRHPELGLVYGRWRCWNGEPLVCETLSSEPAPVVSHASGTLYPDLLFDCFILTSTVMLRRTVVTEVGWFDTSLQRGEDYDYWMRVAQRYPIDKLDLEMTLYRIHAANSAAKYPDVNYELLVVQRHAPINARGRLKRALRVRMGALCFGYGHGHFWRGDMERARRAFRDGVAYRPGHLRNWLYLILTLLRARPRVRA